MSLPDSDATGVQKPAVYQYSFTRGSDQAAERAAETADTAELAHSLELLRSTSLHLSLFKIVLTDVDAEQGTIAMQRAFGRGGMFASLAAGGFTLLLIGTDIDSRITNAMTVQSIYAALADLGLRSRLEVAAIHSPAPEIGDPDDILLHLANLPTDQHPFGRAA
ncbi:hypothetical protein [Skermanella pratensis]|uniref:hypothetical protein n=1 Tax=Skermanella pratensis TaxID=2233999 RepID=UPI001300CCE7|nr:hypothetical protein [Skermanella pratensis]